MSAAQAHKHPQRDSRQRTISSPLRLPLELPLELPEISEMPPSSARLSGGSAQSPAALAVRPPAQSLAIEQPTAWHVLQPVRTGLSSSWHTPEPHAPPCRYAHSGMERRADSGDSAKLHPQSFCNVGLNSQGRVLPKLARRNSPVRRVSMPTSLRRRLLSLSALMDEALSATQHLLCLTVLLLGRRGSIRSAPLRSRGFLTC